MAITPGEIIGRRRTELGLSQAQLAERLGRTASTVRRWERGEAAPPSSLLPTLANALQVSPRDLAVAFGEAGADELAQSQAAPPATPDVESPPPAGEAASPEPRATEPLAAAALPTPAPTDEVQSSAVAIEELPTVAAPPPVPAATVASSPQARPQRRSPLRRAPAVDPSEGLSYIEDSRQRFRYWLRGALTLIVGFILLLILIWAFGELRTALSDVWGLFGDDAPPVTSPGTDF